MADQQPSTSDASNGSSDSSVELNIKTLNSQIYSVVADKNMLVSAFKEKIAGQVGLPVEQQRLIFRGKVLKDEHLLSEYHVENGHTLHLVERQPSQSQPSSGPNAGSNNSGRIGQEPGVGGPRGRVGQISHSVVLGTFNVGEQGEGTMPDLSRVIGAVLNSFGIGNQPGMQPSVQVPQRNGAEGTTNGSGSQNSGVNPSQTGQSFTGQSLPQVVQIPVGAAIAIPSFNMPIPDSLSTICEFVNRMEQAMSEQGYQPSQSPPSTDNSRTNALPYSPLGIPSAEALSIVLRRIQHLIGGQGIAALSHVAGRLEQEAGSNDPTVRAQIQNESIQVGLAMQHLGALLLELGRTMLTLRMGQSPAESFVNAGPAVYVSPSGPNPIMAQPFPLQSTSIFGGPTAVPPNSGMLGPIGLGSTPRNVNIHIHAGASLPPFVSGVGTRNSNAEGTQGERVDGSGSGSGDSGQSRVHPLRNFNVAAVPVRPAGVAVSGTAEPSVGIALSPADFFPRPGVVSQVNLPVGNSAGTFSSENPAPSGQADNSGVKERAVGSDTGSVSRSSETSQPPASVLDTNNVEGEIAKELSESSSSPVGDASGPLGTQKVTDGPSSSTQERGNSQDSSSVPIGLGLKGLEAKRRAKPRSQGKSNDPMATSSQSDESRIAGQQVLQSLASFAARNRDSRNAGQAPQPSSLVTNRASARQRADASLDIGDAMSQVLQSPALNGLLAGVSQQTGIGSPNALRNMMEQMTQNPAMRNTVNQIAQQMDSHDLGDMMASLGGGQGGGFDLSRMVQQMMPIVSQALGGVSTGPSPLAVGSDRMESRPRGEVPSIVENSQVDLQQVVQGIEQQSPPEEIFRLLIENAMHLYEGGSNQSNVVNELSSVEGLSDEFIEMLRQDIQQRVQDESNL
ncbi:OLC1v1018378C9 [Oldenlandia corymbosa var. corymbosa]|uniref:OLC1v1018378C9 n=2 Tax=Oldenlandia corymbosa var. corymbosa TaxID=529605 RepID=A0AAV1EBJ0_OLDCO|nr:OLC1v1018378C9 [Oldenlandia corymbosa var. corymbosa]